MSIIWGKKAYTNIRLKCWHYTGTCLNTDEKTIAFNFLDRSMKFQHYEGNLNSREKIREKTHIYGYFSECKKESKKQIDETSSENYVTYFFFL